MYVYIYYFNEIMKNGVRFFVFQRFNPCVSFEGLTHAYLVKTSIAHNEYLRPWFFKDSDPISAESAAQILSFNLA